ncbi:MAG: hypothetical protein MJK13_00775 [Pseudomonadales bacterium]|nr:hypothetical protein [Pseudomonadales bacterium]
MRGKSVRPSQVVTAIAGMVIGWAIVTDIQQHIFTALCVAIIFIAVALLCREIENTLREVSCGSINKTHNGKGYG